MLEPRYVQFRQPQSFSDCARLCVVLGREFNEVADSLGLPDRDARGVALRNASHLVGAATMILNVLDSGTRNREEDVRALLSLRRGSTQVATYDLEKFARIGLVTLVQFQIENLLANLVRAHGSNPYRGYSRLADQVLELTTTPVRRARNALLVPSWIRNTLHNNGIHE